MPSSAGEALGKLSAVIAALRERSSHPLRFVGLASRLSRTLLAEHEIDRWYDVAVDDREAIGGVVRGEGVTAGLVVLERPVATALEASGVPTVFVDSLPFLWTEVDRSTLPLDVSVYCAQRCVDLPQQCREVLASVRNLRWVSAVVPPAVAARTGRDHGRRPADAPGQRALVSLGGLRSPTLSDWTCYPRLVVPAVLGALEDFDIREVHVAGNLAPGFPVEPLCGSRVRVSYGPLGHGEFLDRLAAADVLLTSPGLTTLLEAGALARPVVCLPPQNLSQIFNARFHSRAVGADIRVRWPERVFREDRFLTRSAKTRKHLDHSTGQDRRNDSRTPNADGNTRPAPDTGQRLPPTDTGAAPSCAMGRGRDVAAARAPCPAPGALCH